MNHGCTVASPIRMFVGILVLSLVFSLTSCESCGGEKTLEGERVKLEKKIAALGKEEQRLQQRLEKKPNDRDLGEKLQSVQGQKGFLGFLIGAIDAVQKEEAALHKGDSTNVANKERLAVLEEGKKVILKAWGDFKKRPLEEVVQEFDSGWKRVAKALAALEGGASNQVNEEGEKVGQVSSELPPKPNPAKPLPERSGVNLVVPGKPGDIYEGRGHPGPCRDGCNHHRTVTPGYFAISDHVHTIEKCGKYYNDRAGEQYFTEHTSADVGE